MITVVGSLNMDLIIEVARFPSPGEAIQGRNFRRSGGGKGANQAAAVARLGQASTLVGAVGDDAFGRELLANLTAAQVDVSNVDVDPTAATGTAMILIDDSGQNEIIIASGANGSLTAAAVSARVTLIRQSRAIITQLETTVDAAETALRLAREAGALTVLNPAPFVAVDDRLLRLADWIVPNEIEARQLTNVAVSNPLSAASAARILRNRSGSANIAITLGSQGVWLDTPPFTGLIPAFPVAAVDTVGAGDAFIGAFVTRLVEGAAPEEAARFGCAAAAISVTRHGAQASMPFRAEVEARLAG